jgi:uncharacterized protein
MYDRDYLYLHGFASGPNSAKGKILRDRWCKLGQRIATPDLNAGDFAHLTLTRQIQQVSAQWATRSAHPTAVTIIGSSLGGLTAAWLGQRCLQVDRLILLAPAFGFLTYWLPRLGDPLLAQWRSQQWLSVYHHGTQKVESIHYNFVTDLQQYNEIQLTRSIPTLILHGTQDEVIPIQASRDFAAQRSQVELVEVEDDHALTQLPEALWQQIETFAGVV